MKFQLFIAIAFLLIIASLYTVSANNTAAANRDVGIKYVNYLVGEVNKFMFSEDGKLNKNFLEQIDAGVAKEKEFLVKRMGVQAYNEFRNSLLKANGGQKIRTFQQNIMNVLIHEIQRVLNYKYKLPANGESFHYPAQSCTEMSNKTAHIAWINPSMNDASSTVQQYCSNNWGIVGKVGSDAVRGEVKLFSANINEGQLSNNNPMIRSNDVAFFEASQFKSYGNSFALAVQDGSTSVIFRPSNAKGTGCTLANLCTSECACESAQVGSLDVSKASFDGVRRPLIPGSKNTLIYSIYRV